MTNTERLLSGADKVVRDSLPVLLEAAGSATAADLLRGLPALSDEGAALRSVEALRGVRGAADCDALEDAIFWSEAAVCAALRGDARAFRDHVRRANAALERGLPVRWLH